MLIWSVYGLSKKFIIYYCRYRYWEVLYRAQVRINIWILTGCISQAVPLVFPGQTL
jgi:hypothetical protein